MSEEASQIKTAEDPLVGEDLTPNKDGGVIKTIKKAGSGDDKPCKNNKVIVHYTGRLLDGTVFDSSVNRGEKFTFNLGKGEVIKSWDLGVASMRRGEVCELTCRSDYAYGERGSPPSIPPNATLVFEIELFDWEGEDISEDKDKGIIRNIIKEGEGYSNPNDDALVNIHLVGSFQNKIFDDRKVEFNVGDIADDSIPDSINTCVKKMKSAEKSNFFINSKYGFGSQGNSLFNIPANANLQYTIELLSFEKSKEAWEMDDKEKIEQAGITKNKGTEFLKAGKYTRAAKQYKKLLDYLSSKENEDDEDINKKWNELKVAGNLNLALCNMKLKDYAEVIRNCSEAMEIDPTNEKALYRSGEAHLSMKYYAEAKIKFEEVVKVNAQNKSAIKKIQECKNGLKVIQEKEKKTYKGMFDKFAKQDEKEQIKKKKLMQAAKKQNAENNTNGHGDKIGVENKKENSEEIKEVEQPMES